MEIKSILVKEAIVHREIIIYNFKPHTINIKRRLLPSDYQYIQCDFKNSMDTLLQLKHTRKTWALPEAERERNNFTEQQNKQLEDSVLTFA
jgi:hypothetical protein